MTTRHFFTASCLRRAAGAVVTLAGFLMVPLDAQLLSHLQLFPERVAVGDPTIAANEGKEGPKGVAAADFDGDGKPDLAVSNLDGTITVLLRRDKGFASPLHLRTGARELRGILAADLNGDGKPDIATASPLDGQLMVYFNPGGGNFGARTLLPAWTGVRSLATGDFDGDGIADLAAGGPGRGVRHFRGIGGGDFEVMGDLDRLSPRLRDLVNTRPVYSMRTLRSRDGLRDDLLVTHADIPALWILSTVPADHSADPPVDASKLPAWRNNPSPVLLHEVQVLNANTLHAADGSAQPWVELLNKSTAPVNLAGWSLSLNTVAWTFPSVTLEPGRFLTVFLSGQNLTAGPELHSSFILKQSTDALNLLQPNGELANTIDLPKHTVTDISRGLAPDSDAIKWFDVPSPGAQNNAGRGSLDDLEGAANTQTALIIFPPHPLATQEVTVTVTMPEHPMGNTSVRNVWFSASPGLTEEHHLMHRIAPGVYKEVLPPGVFSGNTPHRVLARLRDIGTSNDFTVEMHRGLDEEVAVKFETRPGCLRPVASVPSPKVKAFEAGAVTTQADLPGAQPDLVYADEEGGRLTIHRAAPDARRFEPMASQSVPINSAPRDVKLADTNRDGWNEATVVLRSLDLAVTYKNENGLLRATAEVPTGRSPREVVMADFTGDGKPDAAVINRESGDVSILPTSDDASGFVSLNQIYPVDGGVAALLVRDLNGDGRDDVMQLHRASGEISIRYADPDGSLRTPVFSSLGPYGASAVTIGDVNDDGRLDVLSANLGEAGAGSISVLLAKATGGFDSPLTFNASGSLFAISVADFNNDGKKDVVAGYLDCSLEFFTGDGTGQFAPMYDAPVPFVNEARVMVTADFDQDGDIDIAGAGFEGDMVTLENTGATTRQSWLKRLYPPPSAMSFGTERIGLTMVNGDADPDLIIGTGHGVVMYEGRIGMHFALAPTYTSDTGLNFAVSDVLTSDLDDDGAQDMVAACRAAACINILTQAPGGHFLPKVQVDVPSARYIATGDLDGDGKPDLVGTGDALWTVLSSRAPEVAPAPGASPSGRPQSSQVVINEILARNTGVPVAEDNERKTDFVELFNGASTAENLEGWKLHVKSTQEGAPLNETWVFPETTVGKRGRIVITCAPRPDPPAPGSLYTGFALPAEGGIIRLLKPDDSEADHVTYPHAQPNVSWSRFLDGHPAFHANPIPSPGRANSDNGRVPPEVKLTPPSPARMKAYQPLTFTARGRDDLAIISMSLVWNRLDTPYPAAQRLVLYDNGVLPDTKAMDGFFVGQLPGLPAEAEVQFYLEAEDLSGEVLRLPEDAKLTGAAEPPVAWTFSLSSPPSLEIVEVCTDNTSLARDETGGHPDYVKVRNRGTTPVDLSKILLARSPLSDSSALFSYPSGFILPAGGEVTVFADGNPSEGPLHAPFSLDAGGDDLSLIAVMPSGARLWIHSLTVPAMATDSRFIGLPGTDLRAVVTPTADLTDWVGVSYDADGTAMATAHFRAVAGTTYSVEGDAADEPVAWTMVASITGDNAVHTITRPLAEMAALRIIPSTGLPVLRIDAVLPGSNTTGIYGKATGAATVTLFYGRTNGSANPSGWDHSLSSTGSTIEFVPSGLTPNTRYYYRLRATTTAGDVWSGPGVAFTTLPSNAPLVTSLALTRLSPTEATVEIGVNTYVAPGSVRLVAGTTDGFRSAWQLGATATINAKGTRWTARLSGLARETEYYVRAFGGGALSAMRLHFRTPNEDENLIENLLLTEIMYNPPGPNPAELAAGFESDDFEFLELQNASSASMDLSGLWFEGIAFDFPRSGAPVLPAGGFAVIATNPHAFAMRYGADIPIAGWTLHPFRNSRLSNGGELIRLHGADGTPLFEITYDDSDRRTDGDGWSLEYWTPSGSWSAESRNDYASYEEGGSPGRLPTRSPLPYSQWKTLNFGGAQQGNPATFGNADFDKDGLTNLLEYACGTRPVVRNQGVLQFGTVPFVSSAVLLLTFPVNAVSTETKVTLEASSTGLAEWSTVGFITYAPDARYIPQPFSPIYYSQEVVSGLSPDAKQVLKTIGIFSNEDPPPQWYFRLKVTER